eukprot:1635753-Pyramimonas_sp.AAC.1
MDGRDEEVATLYDPTARVEGIEEGSDVNLLLVLGAAQSVTHLVLESRASYPGSALPEGLRSTAKAPRSLGGARLCPSLLPVRGKTRGVTFWGSHYLGRSLFGHIRAEEVRGVCHRRALALGSRRGGFCYPCDVIFT